MVAMRDGSSASDARLGRIPQSDERNRNYPIRALLSPAAFAKPRGYTWRVGPILDQGQTSSCVGHAITGEAAARPAVVTGVGSGDALAIYRRAQELDEWEGVEPAYLGTSVLAGMKAATERGWYSEYRWGLSLEDVVAALGYRGPVVIGINWYTGMMRLDADGFIDCTGVVEGGHAVLVHAVNVRERYVWIANSWGESWGIGGRAKMRLDSLGRVLFDEAGDAAVPVARKRP